MAGSELKIVAPAAGDVIQEKYRLIAKIGAGGMGVVYEAVHLRLGQRVAIKLLSPTGRSFPRGRFEREARAAARLHGANVVRVFDVDETDEGIPFIVMELLTGHDLGAELSARTQLPLLEAVEYVMVAARALGEVHRAGIVHRDLKPSNMFLAEIDGTRVLKLLDFGISKLQDGADERLTATDATLGTPHYMSPEQTRSSRSVDARSDIWSLGVILYELVTGALPFPGPGGAAAIAQIAADAPAPVPRGIEARRELEAVLQRALAKDLDDRYQSMKELVRALEELAAGARTGGGSRVGDSTAGAFASPIPPRPTSFLAWAALALVVLIGLGGAATYADAHRAPAKESRVEELAQKPAPMVMEADPSPLVSPPAPAPSAAPSAPTPTPAPIAPAPVRKPKPAPQPKPVSSEPKSPLDDGRPPRI